MSDAPSAHTAGREAPAALRIGIYGALGRMGQMLVREIASPSDPQATPKVALAAALEAPGNAHLMRDVGMLVGLGPIGIDVRSDLAGAIEGCDVLIDFSTAGATALLVPAVAAAGVPLVIGTTGLTSSTLHAIEEAAERVAIVRSANMSPGISVLLGLVQRAAAALPDYDVEIVELHHNKKRDAPSGTAMLLSQAVQLGRGAQSEIRPGREGMVGPREPSELGMFAVRGGDVVGEHTVYLFGAGERLELVHRASSREVFAQGALRAARWVAGHKPGLYTMEDVLGLR
jgi:4-hydroxy-tetrahydrodipicolinate reductase